MALKNNMKKILIVGDPHGQKGIRWGQQWARNLNSNSVIFCGDIWDPHVKYDTDIPIHLFRGNHEIESRWRFPGSDATAILHDDYTTFELNGIKFGVLGRMDEDSNKHVIEGGMWMGEPENRSFMKKPIEEVAEIFRGCDILLFHDAPWPFKFEYMLSQTPLWIKWKNTEVTEEYPQMAIETCGSKYLSEIIEAVKPNLVFGGRMHMFQEREIHGAVTIQLPSTTHSYNKSDLILAVLTLPDMTVEYVNVAMDENSAML